MRTFISSPAVANIQGSFGFQETPISISIKLKWLKGAWEIGEEENGQETLVEASDSYWRKNYDRFLRFLNFLHFCDLPLQTPGEWPSSLSTRDPFMCQMNTAPSVEVSHLGSTNGRWQAQQHTMTTTRNKALICAPKIAPENIGATFRAYEFLYWFSSFEVKYPSLSIILAN